MRLQFPVLQPLKCIKESVRALEYKLSLPQSTNLMLILTAIVTCNSLNLTQLSLTLLGVKSVNTLSHFFSYSAIDVQKLMASTIAWAVRRMQLVGVPVRIAVDDTMKHHSRGARKIANVHCLFDHVTKSYCNASCIVFAYLIIGECIRFPVGWRVYKKNGKSKWRLAIEILDDVLEMDLTIAVVLFDSWFCVRGFVKELERRKLTFVGDMKSSNVLEYRHPEGGSVIRLTMEKLLRCGRFLFKDVCLGLKSSRGDQPNKVLYRTYSKVACVAAFGGKYLIVHSVDQRTKASKTFVCNELSWEAQKVLEEYSYRWMIEEFFGNAKGLCGLEKACIRSEQGGALALFLVSYVDLLVSVELWKSVHNHSKGNIPTVSAIFAAAAEENLRSFIENPGAEDKLEGIFAFWLENLQMTRKKVRRSRLLLVEMAGIKREGVINDSVNASISQLAPTG